MRVSTILKFVTLSVLFTLFFSVQGYSQSTGSIGGQVLDEKNQPLEGATIKVVGKQIGALTESNGEFIILNVDVGTYEIEASYIGYTTQRVSNVKVSVDQRTKVNFNLTLGGEVSTEVVEVTATRKGIDVEQSGRIIDQTQIDNSGVRGINNLVSKTAGVVQDERGGQINIRGGRSNESIVIVDGVETTNPLDGTSRASVPNNLLQEIAVLTGGFGAEYGNVLSGVINVSTKSGTDKYTGSVEVITDEMNGSWDKTIKSGYNLYNFTVGGPLIPSKKIANVFNFFGSFERQFQRMSTVSWIQDKLPLTLPDGKIPNNENSSYSYNGRLNINLTELPNSKIPINFRFGTSITQAHSRDFRTSWLYENSDNLQNFQTDDYQFFGRLIHNVSNKFFYELQGSYFKTVFERSDPRFGDNLYAYGDSNSYSPKILLSQGSTATNTVISSLYTQRGSALDFYQKTDVSYFGGKLDATLAVLTKNTGDHEIKFGAEYKYNTLKKLQLAPGSLASDPTTTGALDRWYKTNLAGVRTYGYQIVDAPTGTLIADGLDAKHPITGGFYIRDKVSFADFTFNGGVRIDFFDVNDNVLKNIRKDISGPDGVIASPDDFELSKMKFYTSPRLGFSFPVTDKTIFVAQYGKMIQLPPLDFFYVSPTTLAAFLSVAQQDIIENSSLEPAKLTQYEIGFKQQVGDYINMGLTAFYKESTDLIGAGRIDATEDGKIPVGFVAYLNNDFSISRGLDFYLSMRRMNRLALDISYTLSYATGTGSNPNSKLNLANTGAENPQFVYYLDYDQRHTGNVSLDYRFGKTDVPQGFAGKILQNMGLNVLFSFNSGRPYTSTAVSTTATGAGDGTIIFSAKNDLYKDWNYRMDMKLDKGFNVFNSFWNVYIYAINVLNTKTVNAIYTGTGKPDDNGFLTTETGASRNQTDPVFRQYWPERVNLLTNYGPPRQIRLGLSINF